MHSTKELECTTARQPWLDEIQHKHMGLAFGLLTAYVAVTKKYGGLNKQCANFVFPMAMCNQGEYQL